MPNWCNNNVRITHTDRSKIEALAAAVREGKFCNHVIPVPQDLTDTMAGSYGDDEKQRALEDKTASNIEKHGYGNWYDFCVARWGTKWDVDAYDPEDVVVDEYNTITFGFDSAWSPPTGVYEALVEQGYEVEALYYESGMAFCGVWQDGCDDYWEIGGMSADEVADTIPEHLDENFGISECIREYEEENRDEVTEWYEDGVEKKGLEPHK